MDYSVDGMDYLEDRYEWIDSKVVIRIETFCMQNWNEKGKKRGIVDEKTLFVRESCG